MTVPRQRGFFPDAHIPCLGCTHRTYFCMQNTMQSYRSEQQAALNAMKYMPMFELYKNQEIGHDFHWLGGGIISARRTTAVKQEMIATNTFDFGRKKMILLPLNCVNSHNFPYKTASGSFILILHLFSIIWVLLV